MVLLLPMLTSMYTGETVATGGHDPNNNTNNTPNTPNNNNNNNTNEQQDGNIITTPPPPPPPFTTTTTTTTMQDNNTTTTIPTTNGTTVTDIPQTQPPRTESREDDDKPSTHDRRTPPSSSTSTSSPLPTSPLNKDDTTNVDDTNDDNTNNHSLPYPEEHRDAPPTNLSSQPNNAKLLQTIAGVAGNVLEWYDFAVFGYFSDIIGENFFPPQEDGDRQLMDSFIVFGLAFLMRPVGGLFMGYIGDSYGRKRALEISIFLMAFPTFLMGLLPTYETIGVLSTILLVLVRLLQGLSVGGQLVSSLVFTLENQPREKWGLYGSFVMAAANFGTLLGSLIASILIAVMDPDDLRRWGWRIPFLSGIIVVFSGIYLRYYCEDDAMEHRGHNTGAARQNPIKVAFAPGNRRALLSASLVPMLWSAGFYISFVWMAIFMKQYADPPIRQPFLVNTLALFLSVCVLFPMAGIVSDWYGRARVMYVGGACLAVLSPVLVICISRGNAVAAFFAQSAMGVSLSLWGAPMMAWLVESFPSHVRLTSVAIGYNLSQALIGGSSPALATHLTTKYGNHSPGFIISAVAIVSMIGLHLQPKPEVRSSRANAVLADLTVGGVGSGEEMEGEDVAEGVREGRRGEKIGMFDYGSEMEMI